MVDKTSNKGKTMRVKVISETKQEFLGEVYYLCGKYFQRKGKRLHKVVWKYHKGEIEKGFHVHHKFGISRNQIEELELLEGSTHLKMHLRLNPPGKPTEQALLAAAEWHGSKEGKEWHDKHYEDTKEAFHRKYKRICLNCGKETESVRKETNSFCSNNCKTKWRKKSGVDNEERTCVVCRNPFVVNKYSKSVSCSKKCGAKLRKVGI